MGHIELFVLLLLMQRALSGHGHPGLSDSPQLAKESGSVWSQSDLFSKGQG